MCFQQKDFLGQHIEKIHSFLDRFQSWEFPWFCITYLKYKERDNITYWTEHGCELFSNYLEHFLDDSRFSNEGRVNLYPFDKIL